MDRLPRDRLSRPPITSRAVRTRAGHRCKGTTPDSGYDNTVTFRQTSKSARSRTIRSSDGSLLSGNSGCNSDCKTSASARRSNNKGC